MCRMARGATSSKPFEPGTTGWTAADLHDPKVEGGSSLFSVLEGGTYRVDQHGREDTDVRPSVFPGLVVSLGRLWAGTSARPVEGQ